MLMHTNNFAYGLVTPAAGFAMSFLGALLGLRCAARGRAYDGWARFRWLLLAGATLGLGCVWTGHFIDMLGFTVPGGQIRYNVPETLASALLAGTLTCGGLFIAGYSSRSRGLLLGGLLVGLGIASMHYVGMTAMRMPGTTSYAPGWLLVSSGVAIVGATAAVWSALRLRGTWSTIAASVITAASVGGMHYAGMAAMRMSADQATMPVKGATAIGFVLPLIVVISTLTFILTFIVALAPSEDEIRADAALQARITQLEMQISHRHAADGAAADHFGRYGLQAAAPIPLSLSTGGNSFARLSTLPTSDHPANGHRRRITT